MLNVLGIDPGALLREMEGADPAPASPAPQGLAALATLAAPGAQSCISGGADPKPALADLATLAGEGGRSAFPAAPLSPPEDFEERAALAEFGAGVPREWAEGFARLQCAPPPAGYSVARWVQVVDDAGRFLDAWAAQAAALGWETAEVFGVLPDAPEVRHDGKGLVPLIGGHEVVAITTDSARLKVGQRQQTYYRRPLPHSVAVWGLSDSSEFTKGVL